MKRCIFCKSDSSTSKSLEHIIPESFGNTEHILPPGIVCDKCNNYFAREIEKPLLECDYFSHLRFRKHILSKKGISPSIRGLHWGTKTVVRINKDNDGFTGIYALKENGESKFINHLMYTETGKLIIPIPSQSDNYVMARFLGKVAFEALAQRVLKIQNGIEEIIDKNELDELRDYIRLGCPQKTVWPFSERIIYDENAIFYKNDYSHYGVLHEYDFLYIEKRILYFVLVLFGVEYAINMSDRKTARYSEWLQMNGNKSPLYP